MAIVSGRDRFVGVLLARIGGQRNRRQLSLAAQLPHSLDQRITVLVGHADVADQHVGPAMADAIERFLGRRHRLDQRAEPL